MKTLKRLLLWSAIIVLPCGAACLCFTYLPASAFRDNFLGDWFATFAGAIIGVPAALWLSRKQQHEQEKRDQRTQDCEALRCKSQVLRLTKAELEHNLHQLRASRTETNGVPKRVVFLTGLKDVLWSAFSDGGELQWIKDLQLLDIMSNAYHHIRRVIFLEQRYLEVKRPKLWDEALAEETVGYLVELDPLVIQAIEQALAEIDRNLEELDAVPVDTSLDLPH